MNILDENIPIDERAKLRDWRLPVRQIGYDIQRKGVKDDNIIPFLLGTRRATFLTHDAGFYRRRLCHSRYCLVVLDVGEDEIATLARRLLRHPAFNTQAKRMGTVIRATPTTITVWRLHAEREERFDWSA